MDVILRPANEADYDAIENLTREAFWGTFDRELCNEHLLVHKLHKSKAYIPTLDYVAQTADGQLVGNILYSSSYVIDPAGDRHEMLLFGPLSVLPTHQKQGIGSKLVRHTAQIAKDMQYRAILIFGHPAYYPRFGFQNAQNYGITTREGRNFDAFMALELYPGALDRVSGKYYFADVFDDLADDELLAFDKRFQKKA